MDMTVKHVQISKQHFVGINSRKSLWHKFMCQQKKFDSQKK